MCSTFSQSFTEIIIFVDFLQHVNLLTGACSRNVIKKFGRLIRGNNSFSWLWKKNRVPSTVRSTVIYFLKRKECTFFVSIETEYKYKKVQYRRNSALNTRNSIRNCSLKISNLSNRFVSANEENKIKIKIT